MENIKDIRLAVYIFQRTQKRKVRILNIHFVLYAAVLFDAAKQFNVKTKRFLPSKQT